MYEDLEDIIENAKPKCVSESGELLNHIKDNNDSYCVKYFMIGEHCSYLRIDEKRQKCVYYKND